jgi:putative Ca2+/H+ antiporter (TMEM165/GDT1 family)
VAVFLASLPVALLAVVLGRALGRRIPAAKFRSAVYVLMLALGLVLLIKTIS